MKTYRIENYAKTWWADFRVDGMQNSVKEKVLSIKSQVTGSAVNPTDLDPVMVALGLPTLYGADVTEVELKALCTAQNLWMTKYYENTEGVIIYTALVSAAVPTSVTLAVGSATPVGGVVNIAIPADGGIDFTGAVTGWVAETAGKIKITVVNAASTASTMAIDGDVYVSGADYDILAATPLTVVLTTTRSGYKTCVRTFVISVSA